MTQKGNKFPRPSEEEREKLVLDVYFEGMNYAQIAHELRMSLRDVTRIIKKAKGEPTKPASSSSKENQQPLIPAENFKEMYSRFLKGHSPLHVARSMNLRVEYVTEVYLGFLKATRLFAIVSLYKQEGDEGLEVIRVVSQILNQYNIKPKDYASVVKYMQNCYNEETNLRKLREERRITYHRVDLGKKELQDLDKRKTKSHAEIREIENKLSSKKKELSKMQEEIDRLKHADPRLTALELVEAKVRELLQDKRQLLVHAVDASLLAIRQDPDKNLLIYPVPWNVRKEIAAIPGGIERAYQLCIARVIDIANQLFDQLVVNTANETMAAVNSS